jgi:hypothetical protein
MKNTLIILIVITFFACDKSKEPVDGFYLYAGLEFSVLNSQNEDLLDPENPNHLDVAKIKLFYVIDGETQEVYDADMDSPRNYRVFKHENEYRIAVFLNCSETSDKPITYIQWNNSDTDTIEAVYKRYHNSVLQNKLWLNGEQIWELGDDVAPYFVLIK